jgi:hypothetical protein
MCQILKLVRKLFQRLFLSHIYSVSQNVYILFLLCTEEILIEVLFLSDCLNLIIIFYIGMINKLITYLLF